MDGGSNEVHDILTLPEFVLKGNSLRCKRLEYFADVDLRTTCDTDTKVRKSKMDKVLYEIKDLFAGGWDVGSVRTFIKGIHDEINWSLVWNGEHLLETLYQIIVDRLTRAFIVCHIEIIQNVTKGIRSSRELDEKGLKKFAEALLVDISKVKVKIRHRS